MDFELGEVNPCTINTIERIPYQNGKVSWFLGIMVAMFYSQNSKNILLSSMNNWDRDELFKLFERFLDPSNNVYNINIIRNILQLLFDNDKERFMFKPSIGNGGYDPYIYLGALYNLLNIDCIMFEFNVFNKNSSLVYSLFNEEYNNQIRKYIKTFDDTGGSHFLLKIKENSILGIMNPSNDIAMPKKPSIWERLKRFKRAVKNTFQPKKPRENVINNEVINDEYNITVSDAPSVLIVRVLGKTHDGKIDDTYNNHLEDANFQDNNLLLNKIDENVEPDTYNEITSLKEKIKYLGIYYELESVILYNSRNDGGQTTIVGITCENKKYVYNCLNEIDELGTKAKSFPLIRDNWDINKDEEICVYDSGKKICYNFGKGNRILIYVKSVPDYTGAEVAVGGLRKPKKPTKSAKKPPIGKVLNPKTGRYILIKNKATVEKKAPKKSAKKPPEGKVLNPKTGRYILIKNKATVEKKAPKKSAKKPPEGKVLNPKTGRYILIKNKPLVEKKAPKKSAKKVA